MLSTRSLQLQFTHKNDGYRYLRVCVIANVIRIISGFIGNLCDTNLKRRFYPLYPRIDKIVGMGGYKLLVFLSVRIS